MRSSVSPIRLHVARRRLWLLIAVMVLAAGLATAGCKPDQITGLSGGYSAATIFVNGTATEASADASASSPTLTVTPGTTVRLDLAKTLLKGEIGPRNNDSTANPTFDTVSRCIVRASWEIIGADSKPLGAAFAGSASWALGARTNTTECASGASNRVIDVKIPKDVSGSSLAITVFSALCNDTTCTTATPSKAKRLTAAARLTGLGPRPRDVSEYRDGDRWISGTVTMKLAASAPVAPVAPTARLIARSTPVLLGGGAYPESRTLWREVDARLSTDAAGGALTYSWDLNGDGVYGDASDAASPAGALPNGVAIVPDSVLAPIAAAGGTATVGVTVTTTAGLSSTATTTLRPLPNQSYDNNYRNSFVLSSSAPVAGAALTLSLSMASEFGGTACIDADADGVYEASTTVPFTNPAPATTSYATTALAAGPHEVRVAFIPSGGFGRGTCADPSTDALLSVFRQVYTSVAAAARHGDAAVASAVGRVSPASATMRLAKTTVLRFPRLVGYDYRNELMRGRFAFSLPKRAVPAGLRAFSRGSYVQRIDRISLVPGAGNATTTASGTGTMLMRGRGGALVCVAVEANPVAANFTFVGGRGAGRTFTGAFQSSPLGFSGTQQAAFGLTTVNGKETQTRTVVERGTLSAENGRLPALSPACRSLIPYLDARPAGTTNPPVTG